MSEAQFVVFKLLQMQLVDWSVLDLLIDRFRELDVNKNGFLEIGVDVPSAAQVEEMRLEFRAVLAAKAAAMGKANLPVHQRLDITRLLHNELRTSALEENRALIDMWRLRRAILLKKRTTGTLHSKRVRKKAMKHHHVRLNECHDFAWSGKMWAESARSILRTGLCALAVHLALSYALLARVEGLGHVDAWYFLAATLTTVGYGDIAPTKQLSRAAAIILIPTGLVFFSLVMAYLSASALSKPPAKYVDPESGSVCSEVLEGVDGMGGLGANARMAKEHLKAAVKVRGALKKMKGSQVAPSPWPMATPVAAQQLAAGQQVELPKPAVIELVRPGCPLAVAGALLGDEHEL